MLEAQGPGLTDPLPPAENPPIVGGAGRWPWLGLSALRGTGRGRGWGRVLSMRSCRSCSYGSGLEYLAASAFPPLPRLPHWALAA